MLQPNVLTEAAALLRLAATDPAAAADRMEAMAARLMAAARKLRSSAAGRGGTRDTGGSTDRVQMEVRGPDGEVKYKTDTEGT